MLKAMAHGPGGRQIFMIGLSFGNLDKFRDGPGDSHITIDGFAHGLPFDIVIFSGRTEAHLAELVESLIGPGTKVDINVKLKQ